MPHNMLKPDAPKLFRRVQRNPCILAPADWRGQAVREESSHETGFTVFGDLLRFEIDYYVSDLPLF